MLLLDPDEISVTDTADHALDSLMRASVEHVTLLGRRGPAQAAFTNPELRELGELKRADVVVAPEELELDEHSAAWLESPDVNPTAKRNVELLREYAARGAEGRSHAIEFRFLRSPREILTDAEGRVTGLRVVRNRLEQTPDGRLQAVATGEEEVIECGVVLRSIGYLGRPVPDVPFDERRGLIRNEGGRVTDEAGEPLRGEYVVGWIKRGPSGVIGTNKKDAADTVAKLVADREAGRLETPADSDPEAVEAWLRSVVPDLVTWDGWAVIDEHERRRGEDSGRPRVKVVHVPDLVSIAAGAPAAS